MVIALVLALPSMGQTKDLLITPIQLAEAKMTDPDLVILDVRTANEYATGHIEDAVNLPCWDVTTVIGGICGMLKPQDQMEDILGGLGICNDKWVVVYDQHDSMYASYLFWALEYLGHTEVSVLDGGLNNWVNHPYSITTETPTITPCTYTATPDSTKIADKDWILSNYENTTHYAIVDVRTLSEYNGTDRKSTRGGHIPNAIHVDYEKNLNPDKTFKSINELGVIYEGAGVTADKDVAAYCQSGQKSAGTYLCLRLLGYPSVRNYDGSWEEWGNDWSLPAEDQTFAGYAMISGEELYDMIYTNPVEMTLIDVRTLNEYYCGGYIKGAVSIPVEEFDIRIGELPEDKSSLVVIYCSGCLCGKSGVASSIAVDNGYTNVKRYKAGIPDWVENGYPLVMTIAALDLGSASGGRGYNVTIPIKLDYLCETQTPNISATSNDITFDTNVLENPTAAIEPTIGPGTIYEKDVAFSTPSEGVFRISVNGSNQNIIPEGPIAYVTFHIKADAPYGPTTLGNTPSATDPQDNPVSVSGNDGTIVVGKDDIIIDFGKPWGLYVRYNNSNWKKLHPLSPEIIAVNDIDGNGRDDLIIDFGPGYGIWMYYNNTMWKKLHSLSPEIIACGDIDGTGQDDLIIDFGSAGGIWVYYNDTSWQKLHSLSPEIIACGDIDGTGQDDLIIDFGPAYGIWVYYNDTNWKKLHSLSPEIIAVNDIDGNGRDDLIIDFGDPHGIWIYYNADRWTKLHNLSPEIMTCGDVG